MLTIKKNKKYLLCNFKTYILIKWNTNRHRSNDVTLSQKYVDA